MADLPNIPGADTILIDIREAARRTVLSVRTITDLVSTNAIPHVRVGRRLLFRPESLRAWAAARELGGNPAKFSGHGTGGAP